MPTFTAALAPRFLAPHEIVPETFDTLVPIATTTAPSLKSAHLALAEAIDRYIVEHSIPIPAGIVFLHDEDEIVATVAVVPRERALRHRRN